MITFAAGNLLAFHGKCAIVQAVTKDKIEIRIDGGSAKSVRPKDVEYIHPGPCSQLFTEVLPTPDLNELLELIGEDQLSFREFCELLYSEYSPHAAWSGWLLLKEGRYFTGSVEEGVKARPKEEIEAALKAAAEKQQAKERYQALLERIRQNAILPEDTAAMGEIEAFARGNSEGCRILKDLEIELLPEKAHNLLVRLGFWKDTVNPFPERLGVDMEQPVFELPPVPEEERTDLTVMRSLAIDNAGSNDPDDAVSFADGLLWVHVADPASVVTPGSQADQFASHAGENLYLPDHVLTMLPDEALPLFGLGLQETSPALSFGIRIDSEGNATLEKFCKSRVHVERMTYESAAPHMDESPLKEIREALERFRRHRVDAGALLIRMPEVQIHLQDDEIIIEPCEITPEREMVANAMLAAGAAVADFAQKNEIPMPYAAQDPVEERIPGDTLSSMYQQRKLCTPGYVTTLPEAHAGLGLPCYVRVTSPLRRYADLLAHQQLRRYLDGEELMSSEELEEKFIPAEKEAVIRRKAERQSNEFMTLVYLKRHPEWTGKAIVVSHANENTALIIPELAYEFKNKAFNRSELNEEVTVKLISADPAMLLSRFSVVQ